MDFKSEQQKKGNTQSQGCDNSSKSKSSILQTFYKSLLKEEKIDFKCSV